MFKAGITEIALFVLIWNEMSETLTSGVLCQIDVGFDFTSSCIPLFQTRQGKIFSIFFNAGEAVGWST
jgi:hypothetical protein